MKRFFIIITQVLLVVTSCETAFSKENSEIDSLLVQSERLLKTNTDSSLQLAFKAAEISQLRNSQVLLAKSYMAIAAVFTKTDDVDKRIFYCEKAVEAASKTTDEKLKIRCTLEYARAFFNKGNYDKSTSLMRTVKAPAESINDNDILEELYSGLGFIYYHEGYRNGDSALFYFNKAHAIAVMEQDTESIANSYRQLSGAYSDKKEWKKAMNCLIKALEMYKHINHFEGIATTYKDIGDVYYFGHEYGKAIEHYQKAYEINKEQKNISGIAISSCDLAYMHAINKEKKLLDKYAAESYKLAKQTNSWSIIKYSAKWLSEAYEIYGDYKQAFNYSKVVLAINDSINDRKRIEKSSREEMQGTFENKIQQMKNEEEKRKAIAEEKEKYQSFIRNILIVGILIAVLLLFITYRNFIQKKKANVIISRQKEEVEEQKQKIEEINKEMTDSINYAKVIQRSILPNPKEIMSVFPTCFGLYKPRSVVSGDFYWFAQKGNISMIAAADCTGHGVPGALMSMIGVDKLNLAVTQNMTKPDEILSFVNIGMKTSLKQNENNLGSQDGMDIALCCFDYKNNLLRFAGAQRPLWLIRNNELFEYKGTKVSIGGTTSILQEFEAQQIPIQKNDTLYIFSDGFADQFGGEEGKKMKTKNFKNLLLSIQHMPISEQEKYLDEQLKKWQGNFEQVDDILVIGVKI